MKNTPCRPTFLPNALRKSGMASESTPTFLVTRTCLGTGAGGRACLMQASNGSALANTRIVPIGRVGIGSSKSAGSFPFRSRSKITWTPSSITACSSRSSFCTATPCTLRRPESFLTSAFPHRVLFTTLTAVFTRSFGLQNHRSRSMRSIATRNGWCSTFAGAFPTGLSGMSKTSITGIRFRIPKNMAGF